VARTRDIRTNQADISCDVCGRTLLRGEEPEAYLAGGERRQVCDLCTARAQHEGWIRESGFDDLSVRASRADGRRGGRWMDRWRARRDAAAEARGVEEAAAPAAAQRSSGRVRRVGRAGAAEAETGNHAAGPVTPPPPTERRETPREPRHVRAVPTNADLKMQRALELFNASSYMRTVGGVARSLGPPAVCVRPLVERPSVVTITVMWELSWYRFEVDLSDEAGGVRRDAQGDELAELDPAETTANAAADERGGLHLGAAG
jgi:hypothetical protein